MYIEIGISFSTMVVAGFYIFTILHILTNVYVAFVKEEEYKLPFYMQVFVDKTLWYCNDINDHLLFLFLYTIITFVIYMITIFLYPLVILILIMIGLAFYMREKRRKEKRHIK